MLGVVSAAPTHHTRHIRCGCSRAYGRGCAAGLDDPAADEETLLVATIAKVGWAVWIASTTLSTNLACESKNATATKRWLYSIVEGSHWNMVANDLMQRTPE